MPFAKKPQVFSAKINELTLGTGDKAVVLGGQNVFNLYTFDAPIANRPKIGIDVSDDPEQPCEGLTAFYAGCETLADRARKAAAARQRVKARVSTPKLAATAPSNPAARIPAKVAALMPRGPGVISAKAMMSATSSSVIPGSASSASRGEPGAKVDIQYTSTVIPKNVMTEKNSRRMM